jgi:hypothetical protein
MADDASITLTATILPDEIAKTISGSMSISPADANDKWYYKLTSVSTNDVYVVLDAGTASTSVTDGIKIAAGHSWFANLPNTTVADIHAISSSSTVTCIVAALLDDVG